MTFVDIVVNGQHRLGFYYYLTSTSSSTASTSWTYYLRRHRRRRPAYRWTYYIYRRLVVDGQRAAGLPLRLPRRCQRPAGLLYLSSTRRRRPAYHWSSSSQPPRSRDEGPIRAGSRLQTLKNSPATFKVKCWNEGRSSALPLSPVVNTPVRPASYCGRSAMIRQVDRRRYQIIMVINGGDFTLKVGRGRSLLSKELFGSFEYLRTYISNKSPWRSNLQHTPAVLSAPD